MARVLAAPQLVAPQVVVRAAVPAPAAVPVAAAAPVVVDASPRPYSFGYASGDEAGTEQDRQETQDENGIVRGTYGYRDAQGLFRRVEYIADAAGLQGEIRVLSDERTPAHLKPPGNYRQHWAVDSSRIRRELGYEEPVSIAEALRRTIEWEHTNPPADSIWKFDYDAEDAAIALSASP